jgi:pyruvate/2-oxoglutarate dehydrogenase complex dihydrolipoamide dehydrogenase (E3) component
MSESDRKANVNNTRKGDVDVIVLGVGTSGEDLSLQLLDAGLDVVGIAEGLVGGECPYWACIPSKIMIRAANALQEARRVNEIAGEAIVRPDWKPVAERVRYATGGWDDSAAIERFGKRGGRLIKGRGRLTGPRTVTVGDETITARIGVVIAAGSKPVVPPIEGLVDVDYWTTHDLIQAEELPESLIVLGGGAVGCELGQVMSRFGVHVSMVEAADRLLPEEEPEASQVLEEAFAAEVIDVYTGAAAQRVGNRDGSIVVSLDGGRELVGERLLMATGRKPSLSGLGLDSVGIDSSQPIIPVDERMRAADGVWAMGDVTGISMFTHVAVYHSAIIAADILGRDVPPARYDAVPRAIFTDPEVAGVGMTEADAAAAGLDFVTIVKQLPATFRGFIHGADRGIIKLVVDRRTDLPLGAAVTGPQASEMLGLLTLAVHAKISIAELQSMIFAFPTFYSAIGEAVGAYGRGVTTVLDPEYDGIEKLDELSAVKVK